MFRGGREGRGRTWIPPFSRDLREDERDGGRKGEGGREGGREDNDTNSHTHKGKTAPSLMEVL